MIEVIRQKDDLNREVWEFLVFQRNVGSNVLVMLNRYTEEYRKTKRHKWICDMMYYRMDRRVSFLKVDQVWLPDDVRQEALEKFIETVKVVKEDETKR